VQSGSPKTEEPENILRRIGEQVAQSHQIAERKKPEVMNTILRAIVLLLLLGFAVASNAQETRKLDHFDAVSVTGDISVTLVKGDSPSALIETDGIDADEITLYVKGKTKIIIDSSPVFTFGMSPMSTINKFILIRPVIRAFRPFIST
jgi:hypothetical protein